MPRIAAARGIAALALAAIAFALLIIAPRLSDAQVPPPAPEELPKVLVLARADNPVDALSAPRWPDSSGLTSRSRPQMS